MEPHIRNFEIHDYEAALELWKTDANIGLSAADDKDNIRLFLERNPGLSKVAVVDGRLIGTLLGGQDGRRGYLYHLYVDPCLRRQGLGKALVTACLASLREVKIERCHLFVFGTNKTGQAFWSGTNWIQRDDIEIFSRNV
jgi:N-acetylglutamate synthase